MINFLYTLIILGLAGSVYAQWWIFPLVTPTFTVPSQVQTTDNNAAASSIALSLKSLRDRQGYSLIAERPLFSATRRPAEIEDEPVATPVEEPKPPVEEQRLDGLTLTAIIVKGEERIALMKDPQIDKTLRLKLGESIRGWSVTAVSDNTISLQSPNGNSSDLNLRIFRPPINKPPTVVEPTPPPDQPPPPEAINQPPGDMPPDRIPPQFHRRRSRRPPTL